eukprot:CAMPEP_0181332530 /NCGR_PEP_ID=MMETSP1101-20121128/25153_1 /TAXON_ID=46948 /ORGANISM="Rhodomonas abbreviata, Strain Caron Lab Isolate" /LENGTH=301 /DNA_ID=CAMNT_0023442201 /DNA_START=8 /DNA_END=913 /DNA_ORIENTATION=+
MVLMLCLLSTLYPARHVPNLVNLAPTINQASRRRFLTIACVHWARELVLDDGFSGMDARAVTHALRFYLKELEDSDTAVRLGGLLGVDAGSDYINEKHNDVMYSPGCPWVPAENQGKCGMPGKTFVNDQGLGQVIETFIAMIESIIQRYGDDSIPPAVSPTLAPSTAEVGQPNAYSRISLRAPRVDLLLSDPDLLFVQENWDGDMFEGLKLLREVIMEEVPTMLSRMHTECRSLFVVYMIAISGLFYGLLFRETLRISLLEATKARTFLVYMPAHVLSKEEVEGIRAQATGHHELSPSGEK